MRNSVQKIYGNKVRVRVCGLCKNMEGLLMVNHTGLTSGDFWAPPGGGIKFNESASASLVREFIEETGITVEVREFLFVCELRSSPLHAIELFFEVIYKYGVVRSGYDPEMSTQKQIIQNVKYLKWQEIKEMNPTYIHGVFKYVSEPSQVFDLKGYFKL